MQNKSGTIEVDDIMEVLYGESAMEIDRTAWQQIIKEADKDNDGKLDFEDFKEAMLEKG
jgi:Ca2+-binding EF-hand superfamily protein